MRIVAISDIHVDMAPNKAIVDAWPAQPDDVLILAGDVCDAFDLLEATLAALVLKFRRVFYCVGNHELWTRRAETKGWSSERKFAELLARVAKLGVAVAPEVIDDVLVWPINAWYPEPDAPHSLYVHREWEESSLPDAGWSDAYFCDFPGGATGATTTLVEHSRAALEALRASGVTWSTAVTFSHFLPLTELIFATEDEKALVMRERELLGLPRVNADEFFTRPAGMTLNFSQVAGTTLINDLLRSVDAAVHVHGHQHRNRDRVIAGTRHISHCLGYPRERSMGLLSGLHASSSGPRVVWET